ncbi:MAG: MotA/TolQ/ExbB proton channel family protein [Treponema sp.]|nr:MotA/TolQ/ExbB proton channel family protein [Treponema sp.]
MLETLKSGGILMIPIILCGIIATFIIIERCIYFHSIKKKDNELVKNVNDILRTGNYEGCVVAAAAVNTPLSLVMRRAIECRNYQESDLKDTVETQMDYVVPQFEHLLTALGTIANIATLLGLLGTVTGNIKAFGVLGAGGSMGDPAILAGAIAEALVTTVAGLCVSIPSLIFHNYFINQVNHQIVEMEARVSDLLLKLTGRIR